MKFFLILISIMSLFAGTSYASPNKNANEIQHWEYLDYLLRGTVPFKESTSPESIKIKLWQGEIRVVIQGNYNKQDSLELDKVIKVFDAAIPTVRISWSNKSDPNLVVFFTTLNKDSFYAKKYFIELNTYKETSYCKTKLTLNHQLIVGNAFDATIYIHNKTESEIRKNTIWQSFGNALFNSEKVVGFHIGRLSVLGGELTELTLFDQFFFPTIYSRNFRNDYLNFIKQQYTFREKAQYLTDADTKSAITWLVQLVLLFGLTYFFYQFFWIKKLESRITGTFKRFQVSGFLFFLPQLLCFPFFITPLIIRLQHFPNKAVFYLFVGIAAFLVYLFLYATASLLLYFIEFIVFGKIRNYAGRQVVRVISVFVLMLFPAWMILAQPKSESLTEINLFQVFLFFLLLIVIRFIYFHDQRQKDLIRKYQQLQIGRMEQLQTKLKLEALQARTNPHFLYNSFNTIASLVRQNTTKAEDFALKLSQLFKLKFLENELIVTTITKEIATVRLYLEIEQERFNDRLHFSIEVPDELKQEKIPSFVLLHLVENAVKHGTSRLTEKGEIHIRIEKQSNQLTISVFDNGPDFPENIVYGTGLKNIIEKLNILYANRHELTISKYPQKRVELRLKGNPDEN